MDRIEMQRQITLEIDNSDASQIRAAILVHDYIEKFRGSETVKAFAPVLRNELKAYGWCHLSYGQITTMHRTIKEFRGWTVEMESEEGGRYVEVTLDAYVAENPIYHQPINRLDDVQRYAQKHKMDLLTALQKTVEMDWETEIKPSGGGGKNKLQELREYLEGVTQNGASDEAKAVAVKALAIIQ